MSPRTYRSSEKEESPSWWSFFQLDKYDERERIVKKYFARKFNCDEERYCLFREHWLTRLMIPASRAAVWFLFIAFSNNLITGAYVLMRFGNQNPQAAIQCSILYLLPVCSEYREVNRQAHEIMVNESTNEEVYYVK